MLQRKYYSFNHTGNFEKKLDISAKSLSAILNNENLIGIKIHIDSENFEDFLVKKQIIQSIKQKYFPNIPLSIQAQSHLEPFVFEIWSETNAKKILSSQNQNYILFENEFGYNIFGMGLSDTSLHADIEHQSRGSMTMLQNILHNENFSFDNIVRQWNFIPHIIDFEDCGIIQNQNYQTFNEVRADFYNKYKTNSKYPAATGIGQSTANIAIDFIALKPKNNCFVCNLANPVQIDAFSYSQNQLVGTIENKKPPLFSRAMLIGNNQIAHILVSGTASIIGEKTYGNNIEEQTWTTIENIGKLCSFENLEHYCKIAYNKLNYSFIKVYVKNMADYDKVHSICSEKYPTSEILIVQADICRDDLLVEIECEIEVSI